MRREKISPSLGSLRITAVILIVAEAAVTVLAGFFLRSHFADSRVAAIVWFGGAMVTFGTIAVSLKIEVVLRSEFEKVRGVLEILETYTKIRDPDLIGFKESELERLSTRLDEYLKGEARVESDEYYKWLVGKVRQKVKSVRAVSVRPEEIYSQDDREQNWITANLEAAKRGTLIERIFVSTKPSLLRADNREVILTHLRSSNMVAHVIWKSSLSETVLHDLVGGGVSIYDDNTVFWDQSYFYRDIAYASESGIKRVVPRAIIFRSPHARVSSFVRLYATLHSYLSPSASTSPWAGYIQKLREVDLFMEQQLGPYQSASAKIELTREQRQDLEEWLKLREEIEHLENDRGPETAGSV